MTSFDYHFPDIEYTISDPTMTISAFGVATTNTACHTSYWDFSYRLLPMPLTPTPAFVSFDQQAPLHSIEIQTIDLIEIGKYVIEVTAILDDGSGSNTLIELFKAFKVNIKPCIVTSFDHGFPKGLEYIIGEIPTKSDRFGVDSSNTAC